MISTITKNKLGRKVFFQGTCTYYFPSLVEAKKQYGGKDKSRPRGTLLTNIFPLACSDTHFIKPSLTCLQRRAILYQLGIKKMPYRCAHKPIGCKQLIVIPACQVTLIWVKLTNSSTNRIQFINK